MPRNTPSSAARVEVTPPIATLVLDGLGTRGGLEAGPWAALAAALADLSRLDDVGCVVLHGIGARALTDDLPESRSGSARGATDYGAVHAEAVASALRALRGSRHPTVALIEGVCVTWGLEVATCCDLRVCGESSRLGAAIDRARFVGVYDELRPLAQLLGPTSALDTVLGGGLLGAERALELGLVNRVFPDGAVAEQAYGLAARIAAGAPLLNRWHKQVVRRLYGEVPLAR